MKDHDKSIPGEADISPAETLKASFVGVVLVCGDCEDRGSGPKKLKSKDVRKHLKGSLREAKGRLRVAVTGCLGPCPKKAMTVALVAGGRVTMQACDRVEQVERLGAEGVAMLQPAAPRPDTLLVLP